jgi:hypothetical protein
MLKLQTIGIVIKESFLKLILMKKQEHQEILQIRKYYHTKSPLSCVEPITSFCKRNKQKQDHTSTRLLQALHPVINQFDMKHATTTSDSGLSYYAKHSAI